VGRGLIISLHGCCGHLVSRSVTVLVVIDKVQVVRFICGRLRCFLIGGSWEHRCVGQTVKKGGHLLKGQMINATMNLTLKSITDVLNVYVYGR
jgi:hypothetical protein